MKKYHMQVSYCLKGWEGKYPSDKYVVTKLLDWTNIEDAPTFEEMEKFAAKDKILEQQIIMIADDGESFYIGHNVQNNYPHRINHLHNNPRTI